MRGSRPTNVKDWKFRLKDWTPTSKIFLRETGAYVEDVCLPIFFIFLPWLEVVLRYGPVLLETVGKIKKKELLR